MKNVIVRSVIAVAAVIGLATPAYAAVDLAIKRAIVEVVLDNLGVTASDSFVTEIAQGIQSGELDSGLVTSVSNLLDTHADPRSVIESQTDANGDGVPDEGAALDAEDSNSPNANSTEKSGNSADKSGNSSNRNPNGNSNNGGGSNDDATDDTDESEDDESDDDNSDDDEGDDNSNDEESDD